MNDSVRKAIQLLEELARFKKPVPLRDLAHSTHLNKATAFRLLNSLREKGFVQKNWRAETLCSGSYTFGVCRRLSQELHYAGQRDAASGEVGRHQRGDGALLRTVPI